LWRKTGKKISGREGKDVPAVPNISPEKRAINRRAEFRVIGRSEK